MLPPFAAITLLSAVYGICFLQSSELLDQGPHELGTRFFSVLIIVGHTIIPRVSFSWKLKATVSSSASLFYPSFFFLLISPQGFVLPDLAKVSPEVHLL